MFINEPPHTDAVLAMHQEALEEDGYVGNITRLWAWRPDIFQAFKEIRAALGEQMSLSDREFALVVAATVARRSDAYCSLAWGSTLAKESSDGLAAAVLAGETPSDLTRREKVLASWARKVATDPNTTTSEDIEGLRAVGITNRDIFEVTTLIAFRMAFSAINAALGALPDQQLASAAPEGVRNAVQYGRPVDDTASPGSEALSG